MTEAWRKKVRLSIVISLGTLLGTQTLYAAEPSPGQNPASVTASQSVSIDDLSWLSGHWVGSGLGGYAEEIISAAADKQMMGMFRSLKEDGSLSFYEFFIFTEIDANVALQIKHFNPDMTGWESSTEYAEFSLVSLSDNAVHFEGLSYVLQDENTLKVTVQIEGRGEIVFEYARQE